MKIGLSLPTMLGGVTGTEVVEWSRRIESDGWDTIGLGERISYQNLEMFSTLAAAAAVTERVGIASTITILPMHSEVWVAKTAATLQVLSGGRFTLGVGVGGRSEDYDAMGASFRRRFAKLDEQVAKVRQIWSGMEPAPGLDPVGPTVTPTEIPILSGALGPKSLRRAAEWADGIAGFELDPSADALTGSRDRILRAWDDAGKDAPYLMTSFWIALGPDGEAQLRNYARGYLGVFGEEMADAMASMASGFGDNVARGVEAAYEAGYDEVQLVPTTSDIGELDRISEALTPIRAQIQN